MNLNEVGNKIVTLKRKIITKDMILDFANLTGDKNRIHIDDSYAIRYGFKSLVSHGMLSLSLIIGLMYETGLFDGIIVIFSHLISVKFIRPVYPDTEISARLNVIEKYASKNGNGTYIIVQVTGFASETNAEFISFEAKFKILSDDF